MGEGVCSTTDSSRDVPVRCQPDCTLSGVSSEKEEDSAGAGLCTDSREEQAHTQCYVQAEATIFGMQEPRDGQETTLFEHQEHCSNPYSKVYTAYSAEEHCDKVAGENFPTTYAVSGTGKEQAGGQECGRQVATIITIPRGWYATNVKPQYARSFHHHLIQETPA